MKPHEKWKIVAVLGKMEVDDEQTTPKALALREYLVCIIVLIDAAMQIMTLKEDKFRLDGDRNEGSRISWFFWDAGLEFT